MITVAIFDILLVFIVFYTTFSYELENQINHSLFDYKNSSLVPHFRKRRQIFRNRDYYYQRKYDLSRIRYELYSKFLDHRHKPFFKRVNEVHTYYTPRKPQIIVPVIPVTPKPFKPSYDTKSSFNQNRKSRYDDDNGLSKSQYFSAPLTTATTNWYNRSRADQNANNPHYSRFVPNYATPKSDYQRERYDREYNPDLASRFDPIAVTSQPQPQYYHRDRDNNADNDYKFSRFNQNTGTSQSTAYYQRGRSEPDIDPNYSRFDRNYVTPQSRPYSQRDRRQSSAYTSPPASGLITASQRIPPIPPIPPLPPIPPYPLYPNATYPGIPGWIRRDYPGYNTVPKTGFQCQQWQPYYGYFADTSAGCQAFHHCQSDGRHHSFLCPNGTLFHQKVQTCDWWFYVDCPSSPRYYYLNGRIGQLPPVDATLDRF